MRWCALYRGCLALVCTLVVFSVFPVALHAQELDQDQDMESTSGDYITDKQQSFNSSVAEMNDEELNQCQDMDPVSHDYIMDKQESFNCSMVRMSDDELSEVTAAGFSSFTIQDNVTRAYFNIEAATFTEIDSLKMGYYNDGLATGWDEDWTQVSLGSATESLICKGLYIEASFSNISSPTARTLDSIKVGTPAMKGPITATFNSFSGRVEDGTGIPVIFGGITLSGHRISGLGTRTIYSNNSEFYMQLSSSGSEKGWWFFWKNATVN